MDATDLPTMQSCHVRGMKRTSKKKWDKKTKKMVEVEEIVYGFKVIVIQELASRVIVAAKVARIN